MAKYRHLKNMKHRLRKLYNRKRRLGDDWSKYWKINERKDWKKEVGDDTAN